MVFHKKLYYIKCSIWGSEMAFQFKRDRSDNLTLTLAGDIDLEVTPDIKTQLTRQLGDAASLNIDAASISYLDSSGVSILVIAMQSCKQKRINLSISRVSEEAMRVLQLAKLDKILPIGEMTGKAHLVDVDVFSDVGANDSQIAEQVTADDDQAANADMGDPMGTASDDDLIAALSAGNVSNEPAAAPQTTELEMTPESTPTPEPVPEPESTPAPAPEAAPQPTQDNSGDSDTGGNSGGGGSFTPGTFS